VPIVPGAVVRMFAEGFSYNFTMPPPRARRSSNPQQTATPIAPSSPLAARRWAIPGLMISLLLLCACGRPPGVPDSSTDTSQKLPFDREPRSNGTSPSQSLIPPTRIPEGTSLNVRLTQPVSSASAHSGDSFDASLDDPIVVDEQTLLPHGSHVRGRVLDAKPSSGPEDPGYLRITLVSVNVRDKTMPIDSSSIFTKAPPRAAHSLPAGPPPPSNDVLITADRRLTFRLVRAIDLP
jgi:hypothetical protein